MAADAEAIARELVERCALAGVTVGCAESCTAGLVAATIADIPGASSVLMGGVVSYTEDVKHRVLGVLQETLDTVGAVSERCACEMAAGARDVLRCDAAVSVTGFAGPGGGTDADPVGTVYIGVSTAGETRATRFRFEGDRSSVRHAACREALALLAQAIETLS